jgi:hypothetical protein
MSRGVFVCVSGGVVNEVIVPPQTGEDRMRTASGIVNSILVSFMVCMRSSISFGFMGPPNDATAIISIMSAFSHLRVLIEEMFGSD